MLILIEWCIYNGDVKGSLKLSRRGVHGCTSHHGRYFRIFHPGPGRRFLCFTPAQSEIGPGNLCLDFIRHHYWAVMSAGNERSEPLQSSVQNGPTLALSNKCKESGEM